MTVEKAEKPVRPVKSDVPAEIARLEFPVGTHQYSDDCGEYAVDPKTGKVTRKL